MIDKSQIIEKIYEKKIPESAWYRVKDSLFEDYKQEMYLLLLELPDEKINKLVEQGKLEDYFYQICRKQAMQHSVFMKKIFGKGETIELIEYYDKGDEFE